MDILTLICRAQTHTIHIYIYCPSLLSRDSDESDVFDSCVSGVCVCERVCN
jgi:hypothetical protein